LLFIDSHDLNFTQDADGLRTSLVDIAAVTFDVDGHQIDGANKTWRFRLNQQSYEEVLKNGMVYSINVPIKKPGAYQTRVVLRDSTSQRIGTATQFIEIPDIKSGRLALSGIVLGAEQAPAAAGATTEGVLAASDPNSTPAVRIFKPNSSLVYAYEILNARADRDKQPQLDIQTRLFRDGELVPTNAASNLNQATQRNSRLFGVGRLPLAQIPPGDYALQVIVTDKLAKEKNRIAAQSMTFQVQ
jgi:hypothetical protein